MPVKINGQVIATRGSNKVYYQLDDLDWLYVQLQTMTMAQLARALGIGRNSRNVIRHRVDRYFPDEWKANIVSYKER